MPRADVYVKVEIDYERGEDLAARAAEICRQLRKQYGVRNAEPQSVHPRTDD